MKHPFLIIAATATLVGSFNVGTAGGAASQGAPSEVCYDDLGNTRYVKPSEACKPDEKRTKLIPQFSSDAPADDPQAALQKQVTDLIAKVSALQAQIADAKKAQDKSDKDKSDASDGPPSGAFIDPKTGKPIKSPIKSLGEPDAGDSSLPDNQFHKMPGQNAAAQKTPSSPSGGGAVQRVVAPFEVVDKSGRVILRVAENAEAANGARLTLGPSNGDKYGLRVFNAGGQLVSGVGHGADGGGLVVVSDGVNPVASMSASGHAVSVFKGNLAAASMKANNNGGEMTVYHDSTPVTFMTATSVGGSVVVARNDGFGMFGAQVEANGGGSACVNRISGDGVSSKTCLGIGLPMR